MGLTELILIIIVGVGLFSSTGRKGFATGFKEGLIKNIKKQIQN